MRPNIINVTRFQLGRLHDAIDNVGNLENVRVIEVHEQRVGHTLSLNHNLEENT